MTQKPQLILTQNSPIYAVNLPLLVDHDKRPVLLKAVTALCKCGKSKVLPYCDNSHDYMEQPPSFDQSSNATFQPEPFKFKTYTSKSISIHFSLELCCHAGLCIKHLPTVFNSEKRPWINPNGDTMDKIIEACMRCPSGALTYSLDGVEYGYCGPLQSNDMTAKKPQSLETMPSKVRLVNSGPLVANGNIDLIDDQESSRRLRDTYRFSLCRCGKSSNLPFCNGSHRA